MSSKKKISIQKLTEAIDNYTGIAPAFAQQVAEMLVEYYGAHEPDSLGLKVGDRIEWDGMPFEVLSVDADDGTIEARLLI